MEKKRQRGKAFEAKNKLTPYPLVSGSGMGFALTFAATLSSQGEEQLKKTEMQVVVVANAFHPST